MLHTHRKCDGAWKKQEWQEIRGLELWKLCDGYVKVHCIIVSSLMGLKFSIIRFLFFLMDFMVFRKCLNIKKLMRSLPET